jgi:hypothetical protein
MPSASLSRCGNRLHGLMRRMAGLDRVRGLSKRGSWAGIGTTIALPSNLGWSHSAASVLLAGGDDLPSSDFAFSHVG